MENNSEARTSLHPLDSLDQTFGCRHTNPDSCKKNLMEGVCAFVREDNVCQSPPGSWPRLFKKLQEEGDEASSAGEDESIDTGSESAGS